MKRKEFSRNAKLMAWLYFAWGASQVAWGILQFAVMGPHWTSGLWIIAGIIFIAGGLIFWKTSKNAY